MSYFDEKQKPTRFAWTMIEIDLDINDPALDSVFALEDGSYQTPKTTADIRAFTGVDFKTYRYADQHIRSINHFGGLRKVTTNPPKIDPATSVGLRATATVILQDFITDDAFELDAPYDDKRVKGSHFGKLFARNYLKNRKARIIRGYDPNDFDVINKAQVENYIIDSFSIDPNGSVTLNLVDALTLSDGATAKAPVISLGLLGAAINDTQTSITYTSDRVDEYGAVNDTGMISINKELMTYTVTTAGTNGTLDVVRGVYASEAASHESGDSMQKCLFYSNENIIDVFEDLITNHTSIPTSYIDTANWAALKTGDMATHNLTYASAKPVAVKKLFNELIQLGGLSMYVDVIEEKIKLISSPPFHQPVVSFTGDEHIMSDSLKFKPQFKKLITRQAIFWSKRNFVESDDPKNYAKRFAVIDGVVEAGANLGVQQEAKEIKSNWLQNTLDGNSVAIGIVQRNVTRFSSVPYEVTFEVDNMHIGDLGGGNNMWLGSVFEIEMPSVLNADATKRSLACICTRIATGRKDDKWQITGLTYNAQIPPNVDFIIDTNRYDYDLASDPEFAPLLTEAREYIVLIAQGVTVGSTGGVAFTQGTFPVGASLKLYNLGRIIGKGGRGGNGGILMNEDSCADFDGQDGLNGTDALSLSTYTVIDNSTGLIGGGGGGGSGTPSSCYDLRGGSGGGGGAGVNVGAGGDGGWVAGTGTAGGDGTSGTPTTGGIGGDGGNGGYGGGLGEDGQGRFGASGGTGGNAILKNGNTLIIVAGDNTAQIKGAVV